MFIFNYHDSTLSLHFLAHKFIHSFIPNSIPLLDDQERVQKKVFTNWINYYLPNCIQYDLIEELRDGTKLLALLEVLTGEKLVSLMNFFLLLFLLVHFHYFATSISKFYSFLITLKCSKNWMVLLTL